MKSRLTHDVVHSREGLSVSFERGSDRNDMVGEWRTHLVLIILRKALRFVVRVTMCARFVQESVTTMLASQRRGNLQRSRTTSPRISPTTGCCDCRKSPCTPRRSGRELASRTADRVAQHRMEIQFPASGVDELEVAHRRSQCPRLALVVV